MGDGVRQVECALVPAIGAASGTGDADAPLPRSQDQSAPGSGSVCEQDHRAVPTYRNSYHRCREPSNGSNPCRGRIPVDLVRRCLVCRRSNPGVQDTHGENYRRRHSTGPWWLTSDYRHGLGSLRRTVLVAVAQRLATRDDSPQTARYHAADTGLTVDGRGTSADLVARRSRRSSRRDPSRQRPSRGYWDTVRQVEGALVPAFGRACPWAGALQVEWIQPCR